MLLRYLPILLFIFFIEWYSFQAIDTLGSFLSATGLQIVKVFVIVAGAIMMLALVSLLNQRNTFNSSMYKRYMLSFLVIIYSAKFVFCLFLLLDDFRRSIISLIQNQPIDRSFLWTLLGTTFVSTILLLLIRGMWKNPFKFKVIDQALHIEGLPDALNGLHIVQISDIHAGTFNAPEAYTRCVNMINELKADLVLFTGDLVNFDISELRPYMNVFNKIKSTYGTFAVLGNHDYGHFYNWKSRLDAENQIQQLREVHKKLGWNLLNNEHRIINHNGVNFALIGVENVSEKPYFPKFGDMNKAVRNMPKVPLQILMTHDPTHWDMEIVKDFPDVDLTLSGHTHGMQFGFEIGNKFKWSPVKYAYKHWLGLYQKGKQYLYVNRGLGCLVYPGRVGMLPEITSFRLHSFE